MLVAQFLNVSFKKKYELKICYCNYIKLFRYTFHCTLLIKKVQKLNCQRNEQVIKDLLINKKCLIMLIFLREVLSALLRKCASLLKISRLIKMQKTPCLY